MKCKQLLSGLALGLGLVLSSSGANANTLNFTGNYSAAGYSQIDFTVGSNAVVDMVFNSGYGDPTFSLFDSAGTHIITNDDSIGLRSHITQNLAAGGYELVVSYCCSFITPMQAQGGGLYRRDGWF